jgi:hypothetical protein
MSDTNVKKCPENLKCFRLTGGGDRKPSPGGAVFMLALARVAARRYGQGTRIKDGGWTEELFGRNCGEKLRGHWQFQLALKLVIDVTEEENELTNVLRVLTPVLSKFR